MNSDPNDHRLRAELQLAFPAPDRGAPIDWEALVRLADARPARAFRLHLRAARPMRLASLAAAAGGAALIGVFVVASLSSSHSATTTGPGGGHTNPGLMPLAQALGTASSSFGVPVNLPDTPALKPSDADQTAGVQRLPSSTPEQPGPVTQLNVDYKTSVDYLSISYAPTVYTVCGSGGASCSSVYPNALDEYQVETARAPNRYQIVHLSDGTPALIGLSSIGNSLEFRLGPLTITLWATSNAYGTPTTIDAAALQALAQSIADQAPTSP